MTNSNLDDEKDPSDLTLDPAAGDELPAGDQLENGDKPSAYYPENLPEHMRGADDKTTIDNLFKAYDGARKHISEKWGDAPADASGYNLTWGEDVDPAVKAIPTDDGAIGLARELAHKSGMPAKVFEDFIPSFLNEAVKQGLIDPPIDLTAQLNEFGGAEAFTKERGTLLTQAETLAQSGKIDSEGMLEIKAMLSTPKGVSALKAFIASDAPKIALGGQKNARSMDDIRADMQDPRYNSQSPQHDPAFRRRVYEELQNAVN